MHGPTSIVWANLRPLSLQSLFHFPHQNEWQNHSTTDAAGHYMHGVWAAWGYEEPFVYFDKRMKRWRALFHQYRKAGLLGRGGAGTWPVAGKAGAGPVPKGVMTLQRRERPNIFLDKSGKATWLYNGVGMDSGNRPFTMATPILDDVPSDHPRRLLTKTDDIHAGPCSDDVGCSLNGVCQHGTCSCDPSWRGPSCSTLWLLPASKEAGFHPPFATVPDSTSSWGGTVAWLGKGWGRDRSHYHFVLLFIHFIPGKQKIANIFGTSISVTTMRTLGWGIISSEIVNYCGIDSHGRQSH
jgi:hypothetical protein